MIKRYVEELNKPLDRTKKMILNQISGSTLGEINAAQLASADIVGYMRTVDVAPSTRGHYLAHLSSVMKLARPAWGFPVDASVVADARVALTRMGLVGRSKHRERRPTLDEMDRLMEEFGKVRQGTPDSIPMRVLAAFTIYSLRRISEICRLRWDDLDEEGCRVMVRDLKHPNTKIGNDTWVDLTPEALRIIKAQPKGDDRIFPYRALTASTAFTNVVQLLEIDDLHLNDLRHEGASRLSEMGWTDPPYWGTTAMALSSALLPIRRSPSRRIRGRAISSANDHPTTRTIFKAFQHEVADIDYIVGGADRRAQRQELIIYSWDRTADPAGLF
jgi:integrase